MPRPKRDRRALVAAVTMTMLGAPLLAQQTDAELAQKLANPVAALISLPFQANFERGFGIGEDGTRYTVNVQPVIPAKLTDNWNVISRTILPVISQSDFFPGAGRQTGVGDIVQSVFFSPAKPTASGWIWGAGPVFLLPTASDRLLGGGKFGIGPTAVALRQQGPWNYGALVNHIVSVAGQSARGDVNATFLQPFVSYVTKTAWTYTAQLESTRDWENSVGSTAASAIVSKLVAFGTQRASIGGGLRYFVESPTGGASGLAVRASFALLFPR
jgi:hypothetical protein